MGDCSGDSDVSMLKYAGTVRAMSGFAGLETSGDYLMGIVRRAYGAAFALWIGGATRNNFVIRPLGHWQPPAKAT